MKIEQKFKILEFFSKNTYLMILKIWDNRFSMDFTLDSYSLCTPGTGWTRKEAHKSMYSHSMYGFYLKKVIIS